LAGALRGLLLGADRAWRKGIGSSRQKEAGRLTVDFRLSYSLGISVSEQ